MQTRMKLAATMLVAGSRLYLMSSVLHFREPTGADPHAAVVWGWA